MDYAHLATVTHDQSAKCLTDVHMYHWQEGKDDRLKAGVTIEFIDFQTGVRTYGPVIVESIDRFTNRLSLSSKVTVNKGDLVVVFEGGNF